MKPPAAPQTRRRSALPARLGLSALSVTLVVAGGFAAGEFYCRQRYALLDAPGADNGARDPLFRYDRELGWCGVPNVRTRHRSGVWVTHNAHGYRDTAWDPQTVKPRVLLLGDSNMWGYGVDDEHVPGAILNRIAPDIRWFNAGMNGYGTDQEHLTFRRLRSLLNPDWTVLAVCDNDRWENTRRRVRGFNKPLFTVENGRLIARNIPVPRPPEGSSLREPLAVRVFRKTHSHFLYHLAQIIDARAGTQAADPGAPMDAGERTDPTHAIIGNLFAEADKRLLVVALSRDPALQQFCAGTGIAFLDLGATPAGQPGPLQYPKGAPKYAHWTPEGNRVAAEAIRDAVLPLLGRPAD